jgi:hypothetical protein
MYQIVETKPQKPNRRNMTTRENLQRHIPGL